MHLLLSQILAPAFFFAAILHASLCGMFPKASAGLRKRSPVFHLVQHLSEIEVIFAFYALLFLLTQVLKHGLASEGAEIKTLPWSEALLITSVMTIASTRTVLNFAAAGLEGFAKLIPAPPILSQCAAALTLGPLLGSFITEPAAMTVSALFLSLKILPARPSPRLFYSVLAVLLINVSIGGALTPFAAPPVLLVADAWNWDTHFLLTHFGWKVPFAIIANTFIVIKMNSAELIAHSQQSKPAPLPQLSKPIMTMLNLIFLLAVILCAHQLFALSILFTSFLIFWYFTRTAQGPLYLRQGLWTGIFLASLLVLTQSPGAWVKNLFEHFQGFPLYMITILLTSLVDNAAIAALAIRVPELNNLSKIAILTGALAGGGLTLLANAPNVLGLSLLKNKIDERSFSSFALLKWALPMTIFTGAILWIF